MELSTKILWSLLWMASPINLAAKLTLSPRTEYSLLEPDVPTIPAKHLPQVIPQETLVLIFLSSLYNYPAAIIALAGSSSWDIGFRPKIAISVLPLSSIRNLFKEPSLW